MSTGKKLMAAMSILVIGAALAFHFKKDPAQSAFVAQAENSGLGFHQPVERRLTTTLKPARPETAGGFQAAPRSEPVYKLPTAATAARSERGSPPDLSPSYQRTFSPLGALLDSPTDGSDEPESRPRLVDDQPDAESPMESVPAKHKIADGDTLSKLAIRYLGSADRYLEIYTLNRDVLASPDILPIGTMIKIPRDSAAGNAEGSSSLVPVPQGALRNSGR